MSRDSLTLGERLATVRDSGSGRDTHYDEDLTHVGLENFLTARWRPRQFTLCPIDEDIPADRYSADPIGSQKDGSGLELSVDRVQCPG